MLRHSLYDYNLSVLLVFVLESVKNSQLFAASGASKILGIGLAIEADGSAASGALDLEAVFVAAAVAIVAITIAVIAIAVIAIAIVVAAVAFAVDLLLNGSKILVDLFDVVVQIFDILVNLIKLLCHISAKVDKSSDKLALSGLLVEVQTVSKTLEINCLFVNGHVKILFSEY